MKEFEERRAASGKVLKVERGEREARLPANFIGGHKIDYVKGRVAFDLEWNSKDQTFDGDLCALRTFHECGLISIRRGATRLTITFLRGLRTQIIPKWAKPQPLTNCSSRAGRIWSQLKAPASA